MISSDICIFEVEVAVCCWYPNLGLLAEDGLGSTINGHDAILENFDCLIRNPDEF